MAFVATATSRNTPGIDILAASADATKSISLQVKTCQGKRPEWILTAKAEKAVAENLFYVFVCLPPPGEDASYYIVPSRVVAERVRKEHEEWQHQKPRGVSNVRKFRDLDGSYKDCWDDLGLSAAMTKETKS